MEETPGSVTDQLREARNERGNIAAREHARVRVGRALFGAAEDPRLDRFVLLEQIAQGGMGVVYRAYDAQLDRRVALKLLHPRLHDTERARARLLREARALARLDHPNVVPVHDVVEIEGQVVIVMEHVQGTSLDAWERARPRTWRELVAVYLQAGRGLAAAHALGVIHRDFKPPNAVVGDDGRVRVLDFGLAQVAADAPDAPVTEATAPGEVAGTRGFAAPERLAGQPATEASDQYSFCISLHRALLGIPAGQRVPGWLRALVDRGLSPDPAARHASMRALLDQLGRDRGWRRWQVALVVAAISAAAVALLAMRGAEPEPSCDGGVDEIARVWSPARRAELRAALDRAGADPRDVTDRVVAALDRHRVEWVRTHRDACVAHRRGAQSADVLDRRMLCQQRRLDELSAAIGVLLRIDRATVPRATEVAARMPAVAACANVEALLAEVPPAPRDAAAVAGVRERLSRADALDRAGRSDEALRETRTALRTARELAYAPVIVEAATLEGKILLFRRELAAAIAPLSAAEQTAFEAGLVGAGVVAAARRIYAEGFTGQDLVGLMRQAEVIEPLSRGLRGDRFARPLLLNNLGVLHMSSGDRAEARRWFERARAALDGVTDPDLELSMIDKNLAMLTADAAAREAKVRAVWVRLRDTLGASNLMTLEALYSYGCYLHDPARALPLIREACERYDRDHPDVLEMRVSCKSYLAFLTAALGDAAASAARYAEVADLAARGETRQRRALGQLAAGHVELHRAELARARARFLAVIAEAPDADDELVAHARLGAGLAAVAGGDDRAAIDQLERAIAIYEPITRLNEDAENHHRLALSRLALAMALRRTHLAPARAGELERLAAAYLRAAHPWLVK